ncbi:MAG: ester cyclase [Terracidiphilus sp.]
MPTTLSPAQMKEQVRRHFEDFVNNRKAEVIRVNMTEDFFDHDGPSGKPTGVQGDEEMMRAMYAIFPDLQITIEEMVAEGDKVVCRNRWQGTNSKTGRVIEFHGFVEWRFEGNKIAERWATVTQPTEIA